MAYVKPPFGLAGGALALDEFGGEALGLRGLAAQQGQHRVHGGNAEAELGLAHGGQRHAEVFGHHDVAEPVTEMSSGIFNPWTMRVSAQPTATRSVTAWTAVAWHFSFSICNAAFVPSSDGAAGLKDEFVVHFQIGLAEGRADSPRKRSCAHGATAGPVR